MHTLTNLLRGKWPLWTSPSHSVSEGYESEKTLEENFGLPHVIAKGHLKKLEHLPPLKVSTWLEFARHLEIAETTIRGMGHEFVSHLNHINTLIVLNRKLGQNVLAELLNLDDDQSDFFKFGKDGAKLVNNEFGEGLFLSSSREKKQINERGGKSIPKINSFTTIAEPGQFGKQDGTRKVFGASRNCPACSGQHGLRKRVRYSYPTEIEKNCH